MTPARNRRTIIMLISALLLTLTNSLALASERTSYWKDVDGDGQLDLLLLHEEGNVQLLANTGEGAFVDQTHASGLEPLTAVRQALFADFDLDSAIDIVFVSHDGELSFYRGTGDGTFVPESETVQGELLQGVVSAEWLDYDKDGRPDLELQTDMGMRLLHNAGGGRFEGLNLSFTHAPTSPTEPAVVHGPNGHVAPTLSAAPEAGRGERRSSGLERHVVPPTLPAAGRSGSAFGSTAAIEDQATGACLEASSIPVLGKLYPISTQWYVDALLGSIGIGNTSPATSLDVSGAIRSRSGGFEFPDGTVQTTASPIGSSGALWTDGSSYIHHSGAVGIGTPGAPAAPLHVYGQQLLLGRGAQTSGYGSEVCMGGSQTNGSTFPVAEVLMLNNDSSGSSTDYLGVGIEAWQKSSTSSELRFSTNDGTGPITRLTLGASGKAKIEGDFVLHGSGLTDGHRTLGIGGAQKNANNSYANFQFKNTRSSTVTGTAIHGTRTRSDGGSLSFMTNPGSGLEQRMQVYHNGDVSIGDLTPQYPLDVDGTIRSRAGGFEYPDGSVQDSAPYEAQETLTIGPGDFDTNGQFLQGASLGVRARISRPNRALAGIVLPHGAKLKELEVYVHDGGQEEMTVSLISRNTQSLAENPLRSITFQGNGSGFVSTSQSLSTTVNNQTRQYFLEITTQPNSAPGTKALQGALIRWSL